MTSHVRQSEHGKDEIEIKLPCEDLDALREKLRQVEATEAAPLHLEVNDLYDDEERRLSGSGSTLRLRNAQGETILTYKGPARFEEGIKRREERETRVSDAEQMHAILQALGLTSRFRYEKRREEWKLQECLVALDETPIGRFVEIEGNPSEIRRAVVALGLDFACAIPHSYARLYALKRQEEPELPKDMVFRDRETGNGKRET